jgi:MSHA type pilus biogenesis protein MshL
VRPPSRLLLILFCLMPMLGCQAAEKVKNFDRIDRTGALSRGDYEDLHARPDFNKNAVPPPIPQSISEPAPPDPVIERPDKKVSISITEDVPLKDALIELAREGGYNLELDPRVNGSVIFNAKSQPFNDVLQRLCRMAGLRYSIHDNYLRIERDEAYSHTYKLDYLNITRSSESEVGIATNVFDVDVTSTTGGGSGSTSGGGSSNSLTENNSKAKVKSSAEANFWNDVERTLTTLLGNSRGEGYQTIDAKNEKAKSTFTVNRQAGLISVFATELQHRDIADYLKKLEKSALKQVLIEARILEVNLNDDYKSGINWRSLFGGAINFAGRFGPGAVGAPFALATTATDGVFTASANDSAISSILNMVREFGTTRILSSPRLTVLNNQAAVLKVARNEVYFTTTAQIPTSVTATGTTVSGTPVFTSTPRTVPVGLVMTVQPAIDEAKDQITMTLRPTISRVVDRVRDPSIGLNASRAGVSDPVQSLIPVLAVREMDSVLKMRSGEVVIMGGLMQDSSQNSESGIPLLDEVPLIGNLAKSRNNDGDVTELVILLRAVILDDVLPDTADADLYHRYNNDPRPLPIIDPRAETQKALPFPLGEEKKTTEEEGWALGPINTYPSDSPRFNFTTKP